MKMKSTTSRGSKGPTEMGSRYGGGRGSVMSGRRDSRRATEEDDKLRYVSPRDRTARSRSDAGKPAALPVENRDSRPLVQEDDEGRYASFGREGRNNDDDTDLDESYSRGVYREDEDEDLTLDRRSGQNEQRRDDHSRRY